MVYPPPFSPSKMTIFPGEREISAKFEFLKMATNLYLGSAASTGDMKNNVSKLLREIRHMKLKVEPDIQG